jgi:hypothetical protein
MGKLSRLHREAVISGKVPPIRQPEEGRRLCKVCQTIVFADSAVGHVKGCWGITYEKEADIPFTPPAAAFSYHKLHLTA